MKKVKSFLQKITLKKFLLDNYTLMVIGIFILLFLFALNTKAQLSFSVEEMNKITGKTITPKLIGFAEYAPKGKHVGCYAYVQVKQKWAMFLIGAVYTPTVKKLDALEFSFGGGMEQASIPWRIQSSIFLKKKNFSFLTVFEYGGGGYLYLFAPTYQIHDWLLGARAHRYYGVGPMLGYTKGHFTVWGSPMYEIEEKQFTGTITLAARF
jgi:hypothetical protein